MDYKAEFKAARAAKDWNKVNELWKSLCIEAEIEENMPGDAGGSKAIADKLNRYANNDMPGGIKV